MSTSSETKTKKALTIGGAMIDTIAIVDSDRIERMAMHNAEAAFLLLEEGRKTEAAEISNHCGGGGVNSAVALARLGFGVSIIAKLGEDQRGETVLARLAEEHISDRWVLRDGREATGASVLISSHEHDAAIFTFRGANTLLAPEELNDEAFAVDLVYVSGLSNQSADCFPHIVRKSAAHSALIAANPGIRQLTARGSDFFECLKNIDILIVNRLEARALVPTIVARFGERGPALPLDPGEAPPDLVARGLVSGGFEISAAAFFAAMSALGPSYVVVTDGKDGAYVAHAGQLIHCPPVKVKIAGTAGAGDAFGSTFSAALTLGQGAPEALRSAIINAASVVRYVDTQSGLLTWNEVQSRVRERADELKPHIWTLPPI